MRYTLPAGQNAPLLDMVLRHQPLRHSRSQDRLPWRGAHNHSRVKSRQMPGACQHQHQLNNTRGAVVLVCSDHSQL